MFLRINCFTDIAIGYIGTIWFSKYYPLLRIPVPLWFPFTLTSIIEKTSTTYSVSRGFCPHRLCFLAFKSLYEFMVQGLEQVRSSWCLVRWWRLDSGFTVFQNDKKDVKFFFLYGWLPMKHHDAHQWPIPGVQIWYMCFLCPLCYSSRKVLVFSEGPLPYKDCVGCGWVELSWTMWVTMSCSPELMEQLNA